MATILKEKDVPGAAFVYADVAKHDIAQLKRWLQRYSDNVPDAMCAVLESNVTVGSCVN